MTRGHALLWKSPCPWSRSRTSSCTIKKKEEGKAESPRTEEPMLQRRRRRGMKKEEGGLGEIFPSLGCKSGEESAHYWRNPHESEARGRSCDGFLHFVLVRTRRVRSTSARRETTTSSASLSGSDSMASAARPACSAASSLVRSIPRLLPR